MRVLQASGYYHLDLASTRCAHTPLNHIMRQFNRDRSIRQLTTVISLALLPNWCVVHPDLRLGEKSAYNLKSGPQSKISLFKLAAEMT